MRRIFFQVVEFEREMDGVRVEVNSYENGAVTILTARVWVDGETVVMTDKIVTGELDWKLQREAIALYDQLVASHPHPRSRATVDGADQTT